MLHVDAFIDGKCFKGKHFHATLTKNQKKMIKIQDSKPPISTFGGFLDHFPLIKLGSLKDGKPPNSIGRLPSEVTFFFPDKVPSCRMSSIVCKKKLLPP